jgi:magnesium chelatase family protein
VAALVRAGGGESSESVRARVLRARSVQRERARALGLNGTVNAALPAAELERIVTLDDESRKLIERCVRQLGFSARAFSKVLRVGRTIADLEGAEQVHAAHIAEAIQGRILDREGRR